MSELLKLIQEADLASLEMERAKATVEATKLVLENAKENLESARKAFDEVLMKADDLGIPRQKVRKLIEERTYGLVTSGLILDSAPAGPQKVSPTKSPKAPKLGKKTKPIEPVEDEALESAGEFRAYEEESSSMSLS